MGCQLLVSGYDPAAMPPAYACDSVMLFSTNSPSFAEILTLHNKSIRHIHLLLAVCMQIRANQPINT